jgi:hypothetical protein
MIRSAVRAADGMIDVARLASNAPTAIRATPSIARRYVLSVGAGNRLRRISPAPAVYPWKIEKRADCPKPTQDKPGDQQRRPRIWVHWSECRGSDRPSLDDTT